MTRVVVATVAVVHVMGMVFTDSGLEWHKSFFVMNLRFLTMLMISGGMMMVMITRNRLLQ